MLRASSLALCLLAGLGTAHAQAPAAPPAPEPAAEALPPPADCTFTEAYRCEPGKACSAAKEFGEIDLPARFLVHFEKQIIASNSDDGLPHITTIQSASTAGDNITLQGTDNLVGWIMQFSRTESGASITTVSHEAVLTAFGTCKPAQ